MVSSNKNLSIETWRGIAILSVVVGHVIGGAPDVGMRAMDDSLWRQFYICIYYIHMPLFTAIAGWVYGLKPIGSRGYGVFMIDKFKRLIVPMIAVSSLYYIVQNMTPGTNAKEPLSEIWRIYCFPYTFFWYLQSLFVMFAVIGLADKFGGKTTVTSWAYMLMGSVFLYLLQINVLANNVPNFFGFQGALEQLPYFVAGIGVQRFGKELYGRFKARFYLLASVGLALFICNFFVSDLGAELYKSMLPLWIIPTIVIMLNIEFTSRFFIYLGTYAYTIYLFHGFGTSGGRIILSYLGANDHTAIFVLSSLIGLFVPILVDNVLSRSSLLRFVFLGKRLNNSSLK